MGLDAQLCQKARDLYGWEMKFEGDFKRSMVVEKSQWMSERESPQVGIGLEQVHHKIRYGFVDESNPSLYQPFAAIYAGREKDHQEDVLRAALLHLRFHASEKVAKIRMPSLFTPHVNSYHLWLLEKDNKEVDQFRGQVVPIILPGNPESYTDVLDDYLRFTQPRD